MERIRALMRSLAIVDIIFYFFALALSSGVDAAEQFDNRCLSSKKMLVCVRCTFRHFLLGTFFSSFVTFDAVFGPLRKPESGRLISGCIRNKVRIRHNIV